MTDPNPSFSRRAMLAAAFVGGSAAAAALSAAPAAQAAPGNAKKQFNLTVLGTTDLHNNVFMKTLLCRSVVPSTVRLNCFFALPGAAWAAGAAESAAAAALPPTKAAASMARRENDGFGSVIV